MEGFKKLCVLSSELTWAGFLDLLPVTTVSLQGISVCTCTHTGGAPDLRE